MKIRKPIARRVKRNNGGASASPVTPKLLRDITQKVIQAFRPKNVILFGSYAYGVPTPDSDLDLLIVMESRDCPAERIRKVSDLFDPRPLPMDFIVLTPGEVRHRLRGFDPFLEEVFEKGQMLYGTGRRSNNRRIVESRVGNENRSWVSARKVGLTLRHARASEEFWPKRRIMRVTRRRSEKQKGQ